MSLARVLLSLGFGLGAAGLLASASCGAPQQGCAVETWSGACVLGSVSTIRVTERFPLTLVTLEAIWSPQPNPANPQFTPPELRQELRVIGTQELALRQHLAAHSPAQCRLVAPPAGVCEPSKLVVALPEFTPPPESPAPAAAESAGCAELMSPGRAGAVSRPIQPSTLGASAFQETFLFDEGASAPSASVVAELQAAARLIAAHPELVCVSITGHISRGEPIPLADARARAARDVMVAAGVPAARLMAFGAGIPIYGAGAEAPPPDPQDRRVGLSVLRVKR
ncbi:MAG: hypothetical protein OZ921_14340 [Sorangiineae bacterium]|nr:hypothetical protein [Polyangiaceae bacterium]MEB2323687.1 hypothetical protein [Sorangiineae bacterium]